jgi:glutathione S-transferase
MRSGRCAAMLAAMNARLYVLPGSNSSMVGRRLLEHKGIEYERVDLPPAVHRLVVRALRFPAGTVPALRLDGRRVQGTLTIARALDELRPERPLYPADPAARRAVEDAERWGEEVLQPIPRRLVSWSIRRHRAALRGMLQGARLPLPTGLVVATAAPLVWAATRLYRSTDAAVRADVAALPGLLDRVDALIGDGVMGGPEANAADFQIAPTIRALMLLDDLGPMLDERPAAALARQLVPDYPGRIPPVIPEEWL